MKEELTTQPSWTNGWKHSALPFVLPWLGTSAADSCVQLEEFQHPFS